MIIKGAGLPNLEAMANIIQDCKETLNLKSELEWNKISIESAIRESSGQVLGAFISGELVGFILYKNVGGDLNKLDSLSKKLKESLIDNIKKYLCLEIWCLATSPTFQGKGIMKALMQELKDQSQEIWLEVHEDNSVAIEFYKNEVFQQVGLRSNYYKDGKSALLLTWKSENEQVS